MDLVRAARKLGVSIDEPSSGSHWKGTRAGSRPYTIPAHNGTRTEIDDKYIRAFCRAMGIDERELRDLL